MTNVRDFGAAGDGVTDDTEAIQHAVDEAGGLIEFPPGDYLIKRPIVLQLNKCCLLYTSPSPRDRTRSRMPSSA